MPSGAKIFIFDDVVVKANGGDRIDEQAGWLERYRCPGIVRVLGSWHGGYAMERLQERETPINAYAVLSLLEQYVWTNTAQVRVDWSEVYKYAADLAGEWWPEVSGRIVEDIEYMRENQLMHVRVHGDPTFENVMMRDGNFVLIDPIPGRPYAPDLISVDLGKILQSCCGYEAALAGDEIVEIGDVRWLESWKYEERRAAIMWGLIHVCRFLPYLPDDKTRDRLRNTVGTNMLRLRP